MIYKVKHKESGLFVRKRWLNDWGTRNNNHLSKVGRVFNGSGALTNSIRHGMLKGIDDKYIIVNVETGQEIEVKDYLLRGKYDY